VRISIRFLCKRDEDVFQPCQDGEDAHFERFGRSEALLGDTQWLQIDLSCSSLIGHDRACALGFGQGPAQVLMGWCSS
jgi:hypothetical protein